MERDRERERDRDRDYRDHRDNRDKDSRDYSSHRYDSDEEDGQSLSILPPHEMVHNINLPINLSLFLQKGEEGEGEVGVLAAMNLRQL